jgi:hypothetical protein
MRFLDDAWSAVMKIVKMGSGNDLVGSQSFKSVMRPTSQGLIDSIQAQNVTRSFNKLNYVADADITLGTGDAARKIAKGQTMSAKTAQEAQDLMKHVKVDGKKVTQEAADHINTKLGGMTEAELASFIGRKEKGIGYMNMVEGYFGDEVYGGVRKGVTLGAGAATAIGVRHLSGGNVITNAHGERDIVGIPFV